MGKKSLAARIAPKKATVANVVKVKESRRTPCPAVESSSRFSYKMAALSIHCISPYDCERLGCISSRCHLFSRQLSLF